MGKDVVCIYTREYPSGMKNNEHKAICSKGDEPRDYHAKRGKPERQIPYDISYTGNLKCDTGDFSADPVDRHSPSNARDTGLSPGRGKTVPSCGCDW